MPLKPEPRIPSLYRLITAGRPDEVADTARSLAQGGAEDGTLVWARPAETGRGPGDFTCAVVLRPEGPLETAAHLSHLAVLALGEVLGVLLPPVSGLAYEWPGTLVLNGGKIAELRVEAAAGAAGPDGDVDWVVLRAAVHLAPRSPEEFKQITSLYDEGCGTVTGEQVLEQFARHLLNWANRWLDDGFAPVRTAWLRRTGIVGKTVTVPLTDGELTGTFIELDEGGRLVLETDGVRRIVEVWDTPFATTVPS